MPSLNNAPVITAMFNKEKFNRIEKRIFAAPLSYLTGEEQSVVDVALNGAIAENSVLPDVIETNLMSATNYFYYVSDHQGSDNFIYTILVVFEPIGNKMVIYLHDREANKYSVLTFKLSVKETNQKYITNDLSKNHISRNGNAFKERDSYTV